MASQFVPGHKLTVHPHFETAYEDVRYLKDRGSKTRTTTKNVYTLMQLQDMVPLQAQEAWPSTVRKGYKAPYVNYIVHHKINN